MNLNQKRNSADCTFVWGFDDSYYSDLYEVKNQVFFTQAGPEVYCNVCTVIERKNRTSKQASIPTEVRRITPSTNTTTKPQSTRSTPTPEATNSNKYNKALPIDFAKSSKCFVVHFCIIFVPPVPYIYYVPSCVLTIFRYLRALFFSSMFPSFNPFSFIAPLFLYYCLFSLSCSLSLLFLRWMVCLI